MYGGVLLGKFAAVMDTELKERLDSLVTKYNIPEFAENDPVQFPKRYSDGRDIEISALLTSTISWGRRPMILANAEKLHGILGHEPLRFVLEGDIEAIGEDNIHRTFFGRHLRFYLRGLREIYTRYGSLEAFAHHISSAKDDAPAWHLAEELNKVLHSANENAKFDGPSRCLPDDCRNTALKRFNMALRWLVRNDGVVDMGVWSEFKPAMLYIPLDVHSANTSRALGLLTRKQNDRKAVEELTFKLREFNPDDPAVYDFALFGAGVSGS